MSCMPITGRLSPTPGCHGPVLCSESASCTPSPIRLSYPANISPVVVVGLWILWIVWISNPLIPQGFPLVFHRFALRYLCPMTSALQVSRTGGRWQIAGEAAALEDAELCNDYLAYLADRRYSPATVRAYAFDLLHFARWLKAERIRLCSVDTEALLRYLAHCRTTALEGQHDNVVPLRTGRAVGLAPRTRSASRPHSARASSDVGSPRPSTSITGAQWSLSSCCGRARCSG